MLLATTLASNTILTLMTHKSDPQLKSRLPPSNPAHVSDTSLWPSSEQFNLNVAKTQCLISSQLPKLPGLVLFPFSQRLRVTPSSLSPRVSSSTLSSLQTRLARPYPNLAASAHTFFFRACLHGGLHGSGSSRITLHVNALVLDLPFSIWPVS